MDCEGEESYIEMQVRHLIWEAWEVETVVAIGQTGAVTAHLLGREVGHLRSREIGVVTTTGFGSTGGRRSVP